MLKFLLGLFVIFSLSACASFGDSSLPLTLREISSGKESPNLLVMFPGINSAGTDFIDYGFVEVFQQKYSGVDIMLVDTRFAYTLTGNLSERIQNEIIVPALVKGYTNIWFVGVSLGGLGVLEYDKSFPDNINGMVLIAPYLGNEYKMKDFLSHESPLMRSKLHYKSTDKTYLLWRYILNKTKTKESKENLFLAYGDSDRLKDAHHTLADLLDDDNIFIEKGGHKWVTWKKLWKKIIEGKIFKF